MCGGGNVSSYTPTPVPSVIPGAVDVSSGKVSDTDTVQARYLERLRKKQGFAATIKNEGGAKGLADDTSNGKLLLGE